MRIQLARSGQVSMRDAVELVAAWRAAEEALSEGRWWDAHEHWELVWRAFPPRDLRARRVRALIQWAAALHKLEQPPARPGLRLEEGMARLIARARANWQPGAHPGINALAERLGADAAALQAAWRRQGVRPAPHGGVSVHIPEAEIRSLLGGRPERA